MEQQTKRSIFAYSMSENLKEKTAKGLFWGTMSNGMTQVLNLVFGIFLARLLAPSEYGIVGVLTIFSAIAGAMQSGGFGAGLINIKQPTNNDYNSVFWLNISVSLTLYVILFLCAPLIASFFKQPCLVLVSRVVFLSLPISAVALVSGTYLTKNMMNRELAIISVMALVIAGITGVFLAFMGFSYWSLVWQQLAYVIVTDIGRLYFAPWRPSLHIDFTPVKKMFSFSVKLMLTGIINTLNQNILTFVFGRLFSISSVGNYSQANKWNSMAHSTITSSLGQVAQTVFVSTSDETEREKRVFRKMMRFTAFISFPALFGLAMVSREFILITIGEKWIDSILLLQLLCIGGAFMPLYTLYQNIAISHGRSDLYMWCNLGQIIIQLFMVLILYQQGIVTIIYAYSALTILWLFVWQIIGYKLIGVTLLDTLKDTIPFAAISIAVMVTTWYATSFISNIYLLLVCRVLVAAGLYMLVMKMLKVRIMDECINFILKKKSNV